MEGRACKKQRGGVPDAHICRCLNGRKAAEEEPGPGQSRGGTRVVSVPAPSAGSWRCSAGTGLSHLRTGAQRCSGCTAIPGSSGGENFYATLRLEINRTDTWREISGNRWLMCLQGDVCAYIRTKCVCVYVYVYARL